VRELGPGDPDNSKKPEDAFQEADNLTHEDMPMGDPKVEKNFVEPWYGIDFDGTLSMYYGFKGPGHTGDPIPRMVTRVKQWIAAGMKVKIFTARISVPDQRQEAETAIREWCLRHIGKELEITNIKDIGMVVLYDDRCKQVETNTGRLLNV